MRTVTFSVFTPSERMPEAYKFLILYDADEDSTYYGYFSEHYKEFVVVGLHGEHINIRVENIKEWRYISEKDEIKFSNTIQKGNIL